MHWIYLGIAVLLEVGGTTCMKLSDGLTKITPSILMFVLYAFSFVFMSFALKKMDISITYAIWSGLGTAFIAVIGVLYFQETLNASKIFFISLIIIGVVGLKLNNQTT